METPQVVLDLVDRFECNRDVYRSNQYNETQARHEFIDPLFMALGWDVNNEKGYAEAYKEVIHEDAIKVGGATKAPDYAFRIGGARKFFVEAKRPGVNIKEDGDAAYQLRRYAWSAKLPLSILTDFEEFAVYDCRIKPAKTDKASTSRVLYLTLDKYAEKWDEITSIFSQEAIWKGSFDKYIESTKRKKGTAEVDTAFLKEIEAWRDVLARNIALRNAKLSTRELNFAVQRTIDRIIFLRICEDRGIEGYGQLMALQNGTETYKRVCQIFRRADERYNSGLFHFRVDKDRTEPPDGLTLSLTVDDKVLKEVFKDLYYPDSPYEFSVLPADILGQVYEQFLGKVIRLTPGHRAKVEDKPEVKKAGGVYYTPTYIVDYIVKHTVGKLLGNKTPKQVEELRILDPACGSGSFLLGAYQTLLDWHLKWYAEHDAEKHAKGRQPKVFRGPGGDWRLTTAERKRILLNNIYGVDIDTQAVEVTKLSLLLKVLEGENAETIGQSLRLFHERALPDLADNIKCGNSLIGPDFYEGKQLSLIDEGERYRINAFDWNAEFPEIMQAGGFDAVIGNPPYIRVSNVPEAMRPYLYESYNVAHRFDIYVAFVDKGFDLLNSKGIMGFILPNKFMTSEYGAPLRSRLSSESGVLEVVDFEDSQVFRGATTYTCLLFLSKAPQNEVSYSMAKATSESEGLSLRRTVSVQASSLTEKPWLFLDPVSEKLLRRLRGLPSLGDLCEIRHGLQTGADAVFLLWKSDGKYVSEAEGNPFELEEGAVRHVVKGSADLARYHIKNTGRFVLFPYRGHGEDPQPLSEAEVKAEYPKAWSYLCQQATRLKKRKVPVWYAYRRRNYDLKDGVERLLVPSIGTRASFVWDQEGEYHFLGSGGGGGGGYGLTLRDERAASLRYLLGLLNSRLLEWVIRLGNSRFSHGYYSYNRQYIEPIPIRTVDLNYVADARQHERLIERVGEMIELHRSLSAVKTAHDRKLLLRQIDATDNQIDQLVYDLYGLTDEEIRMVEAATK
ncbi:Eco57I restriction-modification methylase domain-containing protein [Candidatus Bipolaricaulota bacterium]|nr:Eco57I restriction-modification methylase domain-containing protein [Candidatus Bipolaricaulota bacterium]